MATARTNQYKVVTPTTPITKTVNTTTNTTTTVMEDMGPSKDTTTKRKHSNRHTRGQEKLTSIVATTMPMPPTLTNRTVATTRAIKDIKMATTTTNTMNKELPVSNNTQVKVEDGATTPKKTLRHSVTSP